MPSQGRRQPHREGLGRRRLGERESERDVAGRRDRQTGVRRLVGGPARPALGRARLALDDRHLGGPGRGAVGATPRRRRIEPGGQGEGLGVIGRSGGDRDMARRAVRDDRGPVGAGGVGDQVEQAGQARLGWSARPRGCRARGRGAGSRRRPPGRHRGGTVGVARRTAAEPRWSGRRRCWVVDRGRSYGPMVADGVRRCTSPDGPRPRAEGTGRRPRSGGSGAGPDRSAQGAPDDVDDLVDVACPPRRARRPCGRSPARGPRGRGSRGHRRRLAARRSAAGCRRSIPRARSSGRCRGPGPPCATGVG